MHNVITEEDEGIRLDRWFKRHYPAVTQGMLQKWLRKGQVRLDGKKVEASVRVQEGQELKLPPGINDLTVNTPKTEKPAFSLSDDDRQLIAENILLDQHGLLIFNKPAGLAVQGGSKVARSLDIMLKSWAEEQGREVPKLAHRIDRDTSGIVVCATTAKLAAHLTAAFKAHEVEKTYRAIVVGVPELDKGQIDLPLAKQGGAHEKMAVTPKSEGGKWAVTRYQILDRAAHSAALLELYPETGRTHQLRVHMLAAGTPILGDGKYGGQEAFLDGLGLDRQLHLHAYGISFTLPNGKNITLTAPLPDHMQRSLKELGLEA